MASVGSWDINEFIGRLRAEKPVGYLTSEDEGFAERYRNRYATAAGQAAQGARYQAIRRAQARGMGYAPGVERSLARITDQEMGGRERAASSAQDLLHGIRTGRERFEQQKVMSAYGMEFKKKQEDQARKDRKNAMFWNSMLGLVKTGAGLFSGNPMMALSGLTSFGGGGSASDYSGGDFPEYDEYNPNDPQYGVGR